MTYTLADERKIDKWVAKNRHKNNEYQKKTQREYYNNDDIKIKKQKQYQFRKICAEFRNILLEV